MEEVWYMLLSAVVTFLLVVSEILGTLKQTESKSISMLTANLVKVAAVNSLKTPVICVPPPAPNAERFLIE